MTNVHGFIIVVCPAIIAALAALLMGMLGIDHRTILIVAAVIWAFGGVVLLLALSCCVIAGEADEARGLK